jgi:hypothetical protein
MAQESLNVGSPAAQSGLRLEPRDWAALRAKATTLRVSRTSGFKRRWAWIAVLTVTLVAGLALNWGWLLAVG